MGNCHPEKTNVDRGHIGFSRGDNFPCNPLVQSIIIILYWMLIKYNTLHYVGFQNNPGQMNIWVFISYSVNLNSHTTPVRIYGEQYAHIFCAFDIFLEYHPSSSNITRRRTGDIDFYQMYRVSTFVLLYSNLYLFQSISHASDILNGLFKVTEDIFYDVTEFILRGIRR